MTHTFNVTYADELPDQNQIVAGEWLSDSNDPAQVSVEQGMAERLELEIGDTLTMMVGSQRFEARVSSIRSVLWENFKPNFLPDHQSRTDRILSANLVVERADHR